MAGAAHIQVGTAACSMPRAAAFHFDSAGTLLGGLLRVYRIPLQKHLTTEIGVDADQAFVANGRDFHHRAVFHDGRHRRDAAIQEKHLGRSCSKSFRGRHASSLFLGLTPTGGGRIGFARFGMMSSGLRKDLSGELCDSHSLARSHSRLPATSAIACAGMKNVHDCIVDDLLDVSRMISGKMRLDVAPMDVRDVIDAAVETILPAASAKGIGPMSLSTPQAAHDGRCDKTSASGVEPVLERRQVHAGRWAGGCSDTRHQRSDRTDGTGNA